MALPSPVEDDPATLLDASDPDALGASLSVPDSGETSEGGKLKMIVQLLKRCLGVKDIAAMRLSLPASLLEPIPNLEYWQYLDRPDLFAAINDSEDPFERMLAVLRFAFTKDLKFVHGKVCKPYNSVLGEHFRAHWDAIPVDYPADPLAPPIQYLHVLPTAAPPPLSESASVLSFKAGVASAWGSATRRAVPASASTPQLGEMHAAAQRSNLSLSLAGAGAGSDSGTPSVSGSGSGSGSGGSGRASDVMQSDAASTVSGRAPSGDGDSAGGRARERVRIAFLTEQVSHHPPVSAYHAACPARGLALSGVDQIAAKVSGAAVRVAPGAANRGIFVRLESGHGAGERYHITHPVANVNGLLRGSFYVTVSDSTIITCTGGRGAEQLRAVIEYKDESWLGKAQYAVEGVIHTFVPGELAHEEWTKVKHVPRARVVAEFDGSWRGRIRWRRANDDEYGTLLDLARLHVVPKAVRPLAAQLPNESRRLWESVTSRLLAREYGEATRCKQVIEQRQREDAAERKRRGEEFVPVYFERNIESGEPMLTAEGYKAIEEELRSQDKDVL